MRETISKAFMHYGEIIGLVLIAWPAISLAAGVPASSSKMGAQPVISIAVFNYAHVARSDVYNAERQATDLFAKAGVRIAWRNYSQKGHFVLPPLGDSTADFSVRILCSFMIKRMRKISEGYALGESTISSVAGVPISGRFANVFYDRVKDISVRWGLYTGEVLGDAIAHELGHLMLGAAHSARGVMKATWDSRDLDLASRGKMGFSPAQMGALRRVALSVHQDSSPIVLAQR